MKKEELLASVQSDIALTPEDLLAFLTKRVALKQKAQSKEVKSL